MSSLDRLDDGGDAAPDPRVRRRGGRPERDVRLEGFRRAWESRLRGLDADEPLAFPGWDGWDLDGRVRAGAAG